MASKREKRGDWGDGGRGRGMITVEGGVTGIWDLNRVRRIHICFWTLTFLSLKQLGELQHDAHSNQGHFEKGRGR